MEFQLAMRNHDQAIALMVNGEHRQAEDDLRNCFVSIKKMIEVHGVENLSQCFPPSSTSFKPTSCHASFQGLSHSELFVYNRPVYFADCMNNFATQEEYEILVGVKCASPVGTLCSAIVIFNLALLYHWKGVNDDRRAILKAKSLYKSTIQLMQSIARYFPEKAAELFLASMNNYAVLCIELGDDKAAQEAVNSMRTIVLSERPCGFFEQEWEGFVINVGCIFCSSSAIQCAAAA